MLTIVLAFTGATTFAQQDEIPRLVELDLSSGPTPQLRFIWGTEPGVRYELERTEDPHATWQTVDGYPRASTSLAAQHYEPLGPSRIFLRVRKLDEQAPVVVRSSPDDGGFAVRRFAKIMLELADPSGIDPASISLTVGEHGPFTEASSELTWADNLLTFHLGEDSALGAYGASIPATLKVADTAGNLLTHTWSFDLEVETKVADNLFVFGSPTAQRAGQRISARATSALAQRSGAMLAPSNSGDDWTLSAVEADHVVINYTSSVPEGFTVGMLLCNLTPQSLGEVFYRRVLAISDNTSAKTLTLTTEDVELAALLEQAALGLSAESVIYDLDDDGGILLQPAVALEGTLDFGNLGVDESGTVLFSQGGLTFSWNQAYWLFRPSLVVAFETESFSLRRFEMRMNGALRSALIPLLEYQAASSGSRTIELFNRKRLIFLGAAGPVPVWMEFGLNISSTASYHAEVTASVSSGVQQDFDLSFGARYISDAPTLVEWISEADLRGPTLLPVTYMINGAAGASVQLTPQIDMRINSLAGVSASTNPRVGVEGEATIEDGELIEAEWLLYTRAELNLGISVVGVDESYLPSPSPISLYSYEWSEVYPSELIIREHPEGAVVEEGQAVHLGVDAIGPKELSYQWYQNQIPLPGNRDSQLLLNDMRIEGSGLYFVRITDGNGDTADSNSALVEVVEPEIPGFSLIPEGEFTMGEFGTSSLKTHTLFISSFYMANYEVTNALWADVHAWGLENGYLDLKSGFDDFTPTSPLEYHPDHPVRFVKWDDAVKFCNAMSERDGLTPCYYTPEGEILRATFQPVLGEPVSPTLVECDWEANGYRLPTEAEWEKAARGGPAGFRFPWGHTISHTQANYRAETWPNSPILRFDFDVSRTTGWHPDSVYTYTSDSGEEIEAGFTLPVGSFEPNGYGLYDMIGNVAEHCWDYYDPNYYSGSPIDDPRGPDEPVNKFAQYRVMRGGSWLSNAQQVRTASRFYAPSPYNVDAPGGPGFRLVRSR